MRAEKDYEGLLRLFNKNKVKYCVIGAYALAFYARPRYTKDIDILIDPDAKNAEKIIKALKKFSFKEIWKNRERGLYGKERILFIGLKDLIKIKRLSKRKQDQVDVEILKRH